MSKDVIFTAAIGYSVNQVRPFVESCRKHFRGDVYAITYEPSTELQQYFSANSIVEIPSRLVIGRASDLMIDRFRIVRDYILQAGVKFDYSLFTDIRDVFFQGNPFEFTGKPYIIRVFEEEYHIADCDFNYLWLEKAYGQTEADSLGDKLVICAGTTLASRAGALEYLNIMLKEADNIGIKFLGIDQAIHNYIVYNKKLAGVEIVPNAGGEVQTMGNQAKFIFNSKWEVINSDGSVCPVLHQYDRHPTLKRWFGENSGADLRGADDPLLREVEKLRRYERIVRSPVRTAKHLGTLLAARFLPHVKRKVAGQLR